MEQQEKETVRLCLMSNTCFLSIAHPEGMYVFGHISGLTPFPLFRLHIFATHAPSECAEKEAQRQS